MLTQINNFLLSQGLEITYPNIDQAPEEEYAKIRMSGFGASDSSKLLNVNPFPNGTVDDLIIEKATDKIDESISKKASVRMGKSLEPWILNEVSTIFKQLSGFEHNIIKPIHMYGMPAYHLNTNFDGILKLPFKEIYIPVEAKVVTKYGRKYYDFNKSIIYTLDGELQLIRQERDNILPLALPNETPIISQANNYGIPVYYYTQLQQQIMFCNAPYGYLAVIDVDNWDIHIYKIFNDELVHRLIKTKALDAWSKVEIKRAVLNNQVNTTKIDF